jgi:hypothetical protein
MLSLKSPCLWAPVWPWNPCFIPNLSASIKCEQNIMRTFFVNCNRHEKKQKIKMAIPTSCAHLDPQWSHLFLKLTKIGGLQWTRHKCYFGKFGMLSILIHQPCFHGEDHDCTKIWRRKICSYTFVSKITMLQIKTPFLFPFVFWC